MAHAPLYRFGHIAYVEPQKHRTEKTDGTPAPSVVTLLKYC
ncbi:MAG: hypothetical protein AAFY17_06125 [Cyanobacteria bacterium J06642_11]